MFNLEIEINKTFLWKLNDESGKDNKDYSFVVKTKTK